MREQWNADTTLAQFKNLVTFFFGGGADIGLPLLVLAPKPYPVLALKVTHVVKSLKLSHLFKALNVTHLVKSLKVFHLFKSLKVTHVVKVQKIIYFLFC